MEVGHEPVDMGLLVAAAVDGVLSDDQGVFALLQVGHVMPSEGRGSPRGTLQLHTSRRDGEDGLSCESEVRLASVDREAHLMNVELGAQRPGRL